MSKLPTRQVTHSNCTSTRSRTVPKKEKRWRGSSRLSHVIFSRHTAWSWVPLFVERPHAVSIRPDEGATRLTIAGAGLAGRDDHPPEGAGRGGTVGASVKLDVGELVGRGYGVAGNHIDV